MPKNTANIVGSTGANFTITIDSATLLGAFLELPDQSKQTLTFNGNEITIPNLPAGDSRVRLDLTWPPAASDGRVKLGTVTSGTVTERVPHTVDAGQTPGFEKLFGE